MLAGTAPFAAAAPDDFDTLIEILSQASASWGQLGVPFWAFVLEP